jgi:hypothetical protein
MTNYGTNILYRGSLKPAIHGSTSRPVCLVTWSIACIEGIECCLWVQDLKPLQQQRPFQILPLFHTRHSASKLRILCSCLYPFLFP